MILTILINLIAVFLFLYVLWLKLKEDYSATLIFSGGFTIAISVAIFNLLAYRSFPGYWFWTTFIGIVISTALSIYRYKFSVYEFIDSVIIALHPWLALIYLDKFATNFDYKTLILFALVLTSATIYTVFDRHYKSFGWYRSGRVGFSGLAVVGIFFLLRAVIALAFTDMVSFIGNEDIILSGAIAFVSFLGLFNLSRKKL